MFIDDVKFSHQCKGELHHRADVHVLSVVLAQWRDQKTSMCGIL